MSRVTEAVELFREGAACSQAILSVYGPMFGLEETTAMRVAAGFAGGMRAGDTCGAVTGAFMVLGLQHGSEFTVGSPGGSTQPLSGKLAHHRVLVLQHLDQRRDDAFQRRTVLDLLRDLPQCLRGIHAHRP